MAPLDATTSRTLVRQIVAGADGIVGHSSSRFTSKRSSTPPSCKTTTSGLRTSDMLGVKKPPAANCFVPMKPFSSLPSPFRGPP